MEEGHVEVLLPPRGYVFQFVSIVRGVEFVEGYCTVLVVIREGAWAADFSSEFHSWRGQWRNIGPRPNHKIALRRAAVRRGQ